MLNHFVSKNRTVVSQKTNKGKTMRCYQENRERFNFTLKRVYLLGAWKEGEFNVFIYLFVYIFDGVVKNIAPVRW